MSSAVCSSPTIIKDKPKLKVSSRHDIISPPQPGLNKSFFKYFSFLLSEMICLFVPGACWVNTQNVRATNLFTSCGQDEPCWRDPFHLHQCTTNPAQRDSVESHLEKRRIPPPHTHTDTQKTSKDVPPYALISHMVEMKLLRCRHEWIWMRVCWVVCAVGRGLLWEQTGITAWGAACVQWTVLSTLG